MVQLALYGTAFDQKLLVSQAAIDATIETTGKTIDAVGGIVTGTVSLADLIFTDILPIIALTVGIVLFLGFQALMIYVYVRLFRAITTRFPTLWNFIKEDVFHAQEWRNLIRGKNIGDPFELH